MTDAGERKYSFFEWNICNPSLTEQLQTTFRHEASTITKWGVTFHTYFPGAGNTFDFVIILETLARYGYRRETVADLWIHITLNGECLLRRKIDKYHFNRRNLYRCRHKKTNIPNPEIETGNLVLRILIGRNVLLPDDSHLQWLSDDMYSILRFSKYTNMSLLSKESLEPIKVHSYIIKVRWDNFFSLHNFVAGIRDTVELDISRALLLDILKYMYSGKLGRHWPDWNTTEYATEQFQVIDRYKLTHLHDVFVKNDFSQVRVTGKSVLTESLFIPLYSFVDRPIKNASRVWCLNSNPEYEIIFKAQLWHNVGNIISYTLFSNSLARVHVRVMTSVCKWAGEDDVQEVSAVQNDDHTIDPHESAKGWSRVLMENLVFPDDFTSAGGPVGKYFLKLHLIVTDATIVDQFESADDGTLQSEAVRFSVLSNHMYTLKEQKFGVDMIIFYDQDYAVGIHKGILEIRVPQWWKGFENVPANGIPTIAISTLNSSTLPFVLDYMYTGRVFSIPYHFLEEVWNYASGTLFIHLIGFLDHIVSFDSLE